MNVDGCEGRDAQSASFAGAPATRRTLAGRVRIAVASFVMWLATGGTANAVTFDGSTSAAGTKFVALVTAREAAIENAFGTIAGPLPSSIRIKLISPRDPRLLTADATFIYDRGDDTLLFSRTMIAEATSVAMHWARHYWPYYQNNGQRTAPVIEVVDNALWTAYLVEAAGIGDAAWPHAACSSADVAKRLPCEMVQRGIADRLTAVQGALFNENRADEIWPEDFARFRRRVLGSDDPAYKNVQRYGGILLLRPLFEEFGIPRTLAYIAATPFRIEEDNVRISALRYQERARQALAW